MKYLYAAKTFVTNTISEHDTTNQNSAHVTNDTVQMRFHKHNRMQMCARVLSALSDTTYGLDNLTETYSDDAAMLVKIRQLSGRKLDAHQPAP